MDASSAACDFCYYCWTTVGGDALADKLFTATLTLFTPLTLFSSPTTFFGFCTETISQVCPTKASWESHEDFKGVPPRLLRSVQPKLQGSPTKAQVSPTKASRDESHGLLQHPRSISSQSGDSMACDIKSDIKSGHQEGLKIIIFIIRWWLAGNPFNCLKLII